MNTSERMVSRAGLTKDLVDKGEPDNDFHQILQGMKLIHRGKGVLYGDYIKTHGGDPTNFALMEHFADLKRKYVRAEHFMKLTMSGEEIDIDELFDTYSDMAVYAAMGIQLIEHLIERDDAPDKPS